MTKVTEIARYRGYEFEPLVPAGQLDDIVSLLSGIRAFADSIGSDHDNDLRFVDLDRMLRLATELIVEVSKHLWELPVVFLPAQEEAPK